MGKAKKPRRVKLVIGMLAKNKKLFDSIEEFFVKEFGNIDYRSSVLPFIHTAYYTKEMGRPLKRRFVSFKKLIPPDRLASIKLTTNFLEEKFAVKNNSSRLRSKNIVRASESSAVSKAKPWTPDVQGLALDKREPFKRRINIDPGYISDSKLVLATTKDYFHRIYLNKGVYAEVTLAWKKGSFQPFDWTYPDYKTKEYIEILNSIRNSYMIGRHKSAALR